MSEEKLVLRMTEGFHPLSGGGKWKSLVVLFLIGMVIVNALILWYGRSFGIEGYADFSAFYTAGKLLEHGQGSHLYDPNAQWVVQQEFASKVTIRHKALPYIRPPFEAILFLPFALFPYPTAFVLWTVVNIGLLFIFPFLLQSSNFLVESKWLQGLLCFSYVPVAIDLLHGQDTILLLLILTFALLRMKRDADLQAGLLLSLGLIKFHLILPIVLILALKCKTRVVLGFVVGACILFFISVAIVGWRGVVLYPQYVWHLSEMHHAGMVSIESMPNIRGLLTSWGKTNPLAYANWLLAILEIIGIIFVSYVWDSNDEDDRSLYFGFSIVLITTIFTSYYAYSYDMTLFLLPFFLLTKDFMLTAKLQSWVRALFLLSVGVLCSPLQWLLFFGFGQFYLLTPVLLALLFACVKALRVFEKRDTLLSTLL